MPRISAAARRTLVEERRSQILAAAIQVFAAKGYERSTIADIARRARMSEGSIYNYFKNKGDLLVSLPRQLVQIPLSNLDASGTPEEILTALARTLLTTIRQNALIFQILLSALPSMKKETREQYLQQVVLHAVGMLERYFQEQIHQGVFRADCDPKVLGRAFIGMFFPYIMLDQVLGLESRSESEYDAIITGNVRTFLNGVFSDTGAAPGARGKVRA